MIDNKQLKELGFIKVKGTKAKEWFQQIHPELVLMIKAQLLYVLAKSSAIMYLTGGHKLLKKEDYDEWLAAQPDKTIDNLSIQQIKHTIDFIKESLIEE